MTNLKKKLFRKDSLLTHVLVMVLISIVFILLLTFGLDLYTKHGNSIVVPDLRGKTLEEARAILQEADLDFEINDSTFSKTARPGTIRDVVPSPGSRVKAGRILFISINGFSPRKQTIPIYKDQSARQILALLRGLGFESVEQRVVPGGYIGSVVGLQTPDGRSVEPGAQVSIDTKLILLVSGQTVDTLGLDRLIEGYGQEGRMDSTMLPPNPNQQKRDSSVSNDWW